MRAVFELILLALISVGIYLVSTHRDEVRVRVHDFLYGSPCSHAVTYSLGTVDPRFHLTRNAALMQIERAAAAWNTSSGKVLLMYATSSAIVPINFVYDRRQEITEKLATFDSALAKEDARYAALKSAYEAADSAYQHAKSRYDAHVQSFTVEQDHYNAEVESWNTRGGAPSEVYVQLEEKRVQLASQQASLQTEANALNAQADALRSLVLQVNGSAATHNANANTYNAVSASSGEEFDEGEFISSATGQQINIYEYPNEHKLLRVLEHEFGHAIGLQHVTSTEAIMYPLNSGTGNTPSTADVQELVRVCGVGAL